MAAKTGTAEVESVWTTANLLGFGPYDDPKVAFACVSPTSSVNNESVADNICGSSVVGPVTFSLPRKPGLWYHFEVM